MKKYLVFLGAVFLIAIIFVCWPNKKQKINEEAWRERIRPTTKDVNGIDIISPIESAIQTTKEALSNTKIEIKDKTDELAEHAKPTISNVSEMGRLLYTRVPTLNKLKESIENEINILEEDEKAIPGYLQKVKLEYVIDGDTIVISDTTDGDLAEGTIHWKVRLIGINTPESVASSEYLNKTHQENTQEGEIASLFTKTLLENIQYVYLQKDHSETDQYGRLLRYIWLSPPDEEEPEKVTLEEFKNKSLNGILSYLKLGVPMSVGEDTLYEDKIIKLYEMELTDND